MGFAIQRRFSRFLHPLCGIAELLVLTVLVLGTSIAGAQSSWIASNFRTTFAIDSDSRLWAWGDNSLGQFGLGRVLIVAEPQPMKSGFTVVDPVSTVVVAGSVHGIILKSDGTLWAWGDNSKGQLGDGTTTSRSTPIQIGSGYSSVAAGDGHTLAVKRDGTLWAWGDNQFGQLGDGTSVNRLLPIQIGSDYRTVSAGAFHSVAIKTNGELWAWGNNQFGQVGDGTVVDRLNPVRIGDQYKMASASLGHTAAIKQDGTLWAWGRNDQGQLGDGATTNRLTPVLLGSGYSAVATGLITEPHLVLPSWSSRYDWHLDMYRGTGLTLALKSDGTIWQWGGRATQMQTGPSLIGSGYAKVYGGTDRFYAAKSDGTLWWWGFYADRPASSFEVNGLLSRPILTDYVSSPTLVGSGYAAVAIGVSFTVALKQDGGVWTWGWNPYGELGDGVPSQSQVPLLLGSDYRAVSMNTSYYMSVAVVKTDGSLWAWGDNAFGQLGDGTTTNRSAPVLIDNGFSAVAMGEVHTVALKADGTLWTWGYNGTGQLGDGTYDSRSRPVRIGSGFSTIAVDGAHSVAVKSDGSLWEWGASLQAIEPTKIVVARPSPVMIGSGFSTVAAGPASGLALKSDGSLWNWGFDGSVSLGGASGELWADVVPDGSGGTSEVRGSPIQIGNEFDSIASRSTFRAAIKRDGSLWEWNRSSLNQLSPTRVGDGYVRVAAYQAGVFAVKADGTLWDWRVESSTPRTDGTTHLYLAPTPITGITMSTTVTNETSLTDGDCFFAWAESRYAQFFPGMETTRHESVFDYRYYPSVGNALGMNVADGHTYALIPSLAGNALLDLGVSSNWYGQSRTAGCR